MSPQLWTLFALTFTKAFICGLYMNEVKRKKRKMVTQKIQAALSNFENKLEKY